MIHTRRELLCLLGGSAALAAEVDFTTYTDADKEKFLRTATVTSVEEIGHGVTKPVRASMTLGDVKHSAQIQVVNKELPPFFGEGSKPVPSFDSWRFNVAAYKLDRLLELRMVAVAVPRTHQGKPAAFSWWVDDVMFEEVDRVKKDIAPPNPEDFDRQRALSRVFDELIINIDRNLSNLLITRSWKLALIDHSRSFNVYPSIRNRANLSRCSRALLAKTKSIDAASVTRAVGPHLKPAEITALLARRDRLVEFFEKEAKEKGEDKVLFA